MLIYIVKPGDSPYSIAKNYNLDINQLIKDNGLEDIPNLVIGQALILNTGEESNPIRSIEVNGYIVPETPQRDIEIVNDTGADLTYITPSSYIVNADGSLRPLDDTAIINTSKNYGIAALMSITNAGGPGFDPERARVIMSSEEVQNTLFNNMLQTMREKNYNGVNINFEMLYPEDRQLYNQFLRKAVDFFHQYDYPVSTALVPKTYDMTTGKWWGGHDYKAQGEILDFVIVMTYDWGCGACPPMAVAPVDEIRKVLDYAVTVIPKEKILMGVPFYGFDWELPFATGQMGRLVDYTSALQLAANTGSVIQFDDIGQVPYFNYYNSAGKKHVVWFEDARSFKAKYELVNEYGLRGVSYWVLGLSAPQNWVVLRDMFTVAKI